MNNSYNTGAISKSKCCFLNNINKRLKNELTLVAQTKQVVTTLEITPIRFLVSTITLSTLLKVAALPTVGFLTQNWSCCTYVGTWSRCSSSSFLCEPMGTCQHQQSMSVSDTTITTLLSYRFCEGGSEILLR